MIQIHVEYFGIIDRSQRELSPSARRLSSDRGGEREERQSRERSDVRAQASRVVVQEVEAFPEEGDARE